MTAPSQASPVPGYAVEFKNIPMQVPSLDPRILASKYGLAADQLEAGDPVDGGGVPIFKRVQKGPKTAFNSVCLTNSAARPSLVPELQYQCTSEADAIPSGAAQLNPQTLQA